MEKWKRVVINDIETRYEISNIGRCRNTERLNWKTGGVLKPKFNKKNGYYSYGLVLDGKNYYRYVHRLVAKYFIKGDTTLQVNHIDGNKGNNAEENLEWVTPKENMRHCIDNNFTNINKPILQYSLDGSFVKEYNSSSDAERELGLKARSLSSALNHIHNEPIHAGYIWKFKECDNFKRKISPITEFKRFKVGAVQLTMKGEFVNFYEPITLAYDKLGTVDNGAISQVCRGRADSYRGYKWVYGNEYFKDAVDDDIVYSLSSE